MSQLNFALAGSNGFDLAPAPAVLQPLDFQEQAVDAVQWHYERGLNRQLGVAATGLGKTAGISAHIPRRFEHLMRRQKGGHGGLLFIVHRREILMDAARTFQAAYPDKWIGIEMGEQHCTGDEDIIFASAPSIGRLMGTRIFKMQHRLFGVIITDEGHHLSTDSIWDNCLNYMGVGSDTSIRYTLPDGSKPLSLLLTATPNRTDGQGLSPFADVVSFEYNYPWGVRNGWLVDIKAFWARDRSGVTGAEFETESEVDFMARIIRDYGRGEKSLVFARSVAQSATLARTLQEQGIVSAGHVDGTTDSEHRAYLFNRFKNGDLDLISNFAVFQEGTNVPGITTIFDNSPTQSPVLAVQKPGRGTRPHPDAGVYALKTAAERREAIANSPKPWLSYVCMYDPRTNPSLNVVASLTGIDTDLIPTNGQSIMEVVDVIEYMEEERPEVPLRGIESLDDLKVQLQEVSIWDDTVYNEDLKALTKLNWVQAGDTLSLWLPDNPFATRPSERVPAILRFEKHENGRWMKTLIEVGGWNKIVNRVCKRQETVKGWTDDPNATIRQIDDWLKVHKPMLYRASQRGSNGPASERDAKYLKNAGVSYNGNLTDQTARLLIANNRIQKAV